MAVPPPDQLAFYGVVGGLAALGLIDWPVAIAIGVGQAVVARHFNDQRPAATEPESLATGEVRVAAAAAAASAPRKTAARKATPRKTAPRTTAARKATPRKTAARKATGTTPKSTEA
ncbi:MAG: hypothetical protein WAL26_21055 [Mycobacterium sp.]